MRVTMWHERRLSLTHRLVGLAAFAVLPAVTAMLYLTSALYENREHEMRELAVHLAHLTSLELEQVITGAEGTLHALALAPAVRALAPGPCTGYLSEVTESLPQIREIVVADPEGVLRCGSGLPDGSVALGDQAYFRRALTGGDLVIGPYTVSRLDGVATLPLALAVLAGERVVGVVVAKLDLEWLGARLKERIYFEGGSLTIADRDGVIIAREPFAETFLGTRIPEAFLPLVQAEAPGSSFVTSQDGTRRMIGYYPPAATGIDLYVSAGIAADAAFKPIQTSTALGLAIAAAGGLATFALAWLIGDRLIRRPIAAILTTVESWRQGDEAARTGIARSANELDVLASSIDSYMDAISANRAARREAEAQRALLVGELEHRVKNVLAIVQSIAAQTFRSAPDAENLATFRRRIGAMAETHALLSADHWRSADLRATLLTALRPFGLDDGTRVTLDGAPLQVAAGAALAISMATHELCTNAAKYGALSHDDGRVAIAWETVETSGGPRFRWTWREIDGPPVTPPKAAGFGTRMIEATLGAQLSGDVRRSYPPEGVFVEVDAPASALLATAGGEASG